MKTRVYAVDNNFFEKKDREIIALDLPFVIDDDIFKNISDLLDTVNSKKESVYGDFLDSVPDEDSMEFPTSGPSVIFRADNAVKTAQLFIDILSNNNNIKTNKRYISESEKHALEESLKIFKTKLEESRSKQPFLMLGSLSFDRNTSSINLNMIEEKFPEGIVKDKFKYTNPVSSLNNLKQLEKLIEKNISENKKFSDLKDAKDITVLVGKYGDVRISYHDNQNKKHVDTICERAAPSASLFKKLLKDKDVAQSLTKIKKMVKIKKLKTKLLDKKELSHHVLKSKDVIEPDAEPLPSTLDFKPNVAPLLADNKPDAAPLPSEKKRGKYKPKYVLHQRWARMYQHIKKITEDKNLSAKLSPDVANSLKFFTMQYLQRVATIAGSDAKSYQQSISPMNKDFYGYFRGYDNDNNMLKILNKAFSAKHLVDFFSVSDSEELCKTIAMVRKLDVCIIKANDTAEMIREKFSTMSRTNTDRMMVQYEIPENCLSNSQDYENLKQKIVKELQSLGITFQLVGYGKTKEGHHFLAASDSKLKKICGHYGFTPTLQQTARILAQEVPLDKLSSHIQILKKDTDSLRVGSLIVNSFDDLLDNSTFKQFKKFGENDPNSNVGILVNSICKYIAGFEKYNLDGTFNRNGLMTLLQETYAQVLNFMEVIMALDYRNDPNVKIKLADYQTLIFENLNFWLEICVDKNEARMQLSQRLQNEVMTNSPMRPAETGFVNSGVRCMTTILAACRMNKQQQTEENKTNTSKGMKILGYQDSYYEIVETLKEQKESSRVISPPDFDKSLQDNIANLKKTSEKLDVVFVDPQGSLDTQTPFVTSHNIEKIIAELRQNNVVNKPLTVVMDITIGKINDEKIAELIKKYQAEIEAKELNLICFRSIQKFDQFGLDKISGGYYQVFSKDDKFLANFKKVSEREQKDPDPINVKVLNHLYENCKSDLELYRTRTFENTHRVYNSIDPAFLSSIPFKVVKDLPFVVDRRVDADNYFITLRTPANLDAGMTTFMNLAEKKGFLMTDRPSFGFPFSTSTCIGDDPDYGIARICFGIEDKNQIDIFINTLNEYMRKYVLNEQLKKLVIQYLNVLDEPKMTSKFVDAVFDFCETLKLDFTEFKKFIGFCFPSDFIKSKDDAMPVNKIVDNLKSSSLFYAVKNGDFNLLQTILQNGTNLMAKDNDNKSILEVSLDAKQWQCTMLILFSLKADSHLLTNVTEKLQNNNKNICDAIISYLHTLDDKTKTQHLTAMLKGDNAVKGVLKEEYIAQISALRFIKEVKQTNHQFGLFSVPPTVIQDPLTLNKSTEETKSSEKRTDKKM